MPRIDRDLAAALKKAKTKAKKDAMYFALVIKAPGEGTLIVNRNQVKPEAIAKAKKDLGGGQIVKGRCSGEDGQLVFATPKEPSPTLAKTIKAVIHHDAGLTLKVDARRDPDLVDDEEPTPATSATPMDPAIAAKEQHSEELVQVPPEKFGGLPRWVTKGQQSRELVREALNRLVPELTRVLTTKTPSAQAIRTQLVEVKRLMDQKHYIAAADALSVLEDLLKKERLPTTPTVPDNAPRINQAGTKAQIEEGKRMEQHRKEARAYFNGDHKHPPHTHEEHEPRVVRPPVRPPVRGK